MEKKENDDSKDQTKKAVEIVGKCQGSGCSGNLILRFSPKKGQYFIGCSKYPKCRKAYSLPQDGRVITTEDKCKSCGYPIIRIDMGEKGISDMCINPDCPSRTSNTEKKESGGTKDQTKKAVEIVGKCQGANCKGNLSLIHI